MSDKVFDSVSKTGPGVWILTFVWLTVLIFSVLLYRLRSLCTGISSTLAAIILTLLLLDLPRTSESEDVSYLTISGAGSLFYPALDSVFIIRIILLIILAISVALGFFYYFALFYISALFQQPVIGSIFYVDQSKKK